MPEVEPREPTRHDEVVWLEPFPDALLEGAIDVPPGPEARYEQTESISLAFVTALQILPPRQPAVVILRDVCGFQANEAADMLDSTVESMRGRHRRWRTATLRSSRKARIWLTMPVRWQTSRSLTRCSACKSNWSAALVATNFIVGRWTTSAVSSASWKSFFCPFE